MVYHDFNVFMVYFQTFSVEYNLLTQSRNYRLVDTSASDLRIKCNYQLGRLPSR